jgi:serine/threonine protein kinase
MLYEYINGGELWQQCRVYGISNVGLIKYYFKQIIEAVMHLHSYNIVHRDLKVILKFMLARKHNDNQR